MGKVVGSLEIGGETLVVGIQVIGLCEEGLADGRFVRIDTGTDELGTAEKECTVGNIDGKVERRGDFLFGAEVVNKSG